MKFSLLILTNPMHRAMNYFYKLFAIVEKDEK